MNKVKGVYAFKVKGGPGGQEGLWVVDAKNGSGSVEFGGKGKHARKARSRIHEPAISGHNLESSQVCVHCLH